MKCPTCGAAELITDTRNITCTYKEQTTTIKNVAGEYCPNCEEALFSIPESCRVMVEMNELRKKVDGETSEP